MAMRETSLTTAFGFSGSLLGPSVIPSCGRQRVTPNKYQCNKRGRDGRTLPRMKHEPGYGISRRHFSRLGLSGAAFGCLFQRDVLQSAKAVSSPFTTPEDLTRRVTTRVPREPESKLFQNDIFYPDYFAGVWKTESTTLSVACPAGYKLFGRPGSLEAAKEEVNKSVEYQSRFVRLGNEVISDRRFNVTSVAKALMGSSSVLDCSQAGTSANRLIMTLRPNAADGAVFNVDLRVIARCQQTGGIVNNLETAFAQEPGRVVLGATKGEEEASSSFGLYTSETMRQEIRPNTDDLRVMPLIKDIETTSLFITDPRADDCVRGWQRTCMYLTRSDLRYPDARGRPVDVRWYRLKYSKA